MPTITTAYKGDMAFGTVLGRHRLLIDVPAAMGGKDRGPTPPELFVASLGSCVAAVVASYCQRVGLDSRELTARPPDPATVGEEPAMDQGREIQRRRRWVGGRLLAALGLVVLGGQLLLGPAAPVAAQQSDAAAGRQLAEQLGCQLCHSTNGSAGVGPTWQNLAGAQVKLADGRTVTADDAFLIRSILDPDAEIVSGYRPGGMSAQFPAGALTQAQAQAIVAYLKTLRDGPAVLSRRPARAARPPPSRLAHDLLRRLGAAGARPADCGSDHPRVRGLQPQLQARADQVASRRRPGAPRGVTAAYLAGSD